MPLLPVCVLFIAILLILSILPFFFLLPMWQTSCAQVHRKTRIKFVVPERFSITPDVMTIGSPGIAILRSTATRMAAVIRS